MADFWIRVHANLAQKPVAFRAADALGVRHAAAVGHLVMFWGAVSQHTENGHVADYPDAQLEAWACWEGTRGRFAKFLREQHLDDEGRVREWDEYGGALHRSREKNRTRQERWRQANERRANGDVTVTETLASVRNNAITKRNETKREEAKQLTTSRSRKKPRDAGSVDNWVSTFGDWWNAHVGAVAHGQVGRTLKTIHAAHGLDKLMAGATVYADPVEGPRRKTFADFAATCATWIDLAQQPAFDADGNETARTKRIVRGVA